MTRVSRNDPCPCGSGLKYKKCHEGKDAAKPTRSGLLTTVLLGALVVGGAVAVVIGFARGGGAARAGGRPGQVWSPEHGHWHDAPAPGRAPVGPAAPAGTPAPAPPGTPPPGKVWSPEHGHWHDAPRELPPGLGVTAVPVPVTAPVVAPTP